MPCYSPLNGWQSRHVNPTGKRSITFNRTHAYVDKPLTVPCGMCIGCRIDRSRQWAIRCVHESKMHLFNSFLTLTYDNAHLPVDQSLDKATVQKFLKRLREKIGSFRYFAVGEYGDLNKRPHYHLLLFGYDFSNDRKKHNQNAQGHTIYISDTLSKTWGLGHCTIGTFNYTTAAYTARYVLKKQLGKNAADRSEYSRLNYLTGEVYQVVPEFALMSRNPGIGAKWYVKFKKDVFPSDFLVSQGKKHPVPRYYLDKLAAEDSKLSAIIREKRQKARLDTRENNTPDRLYTREIVKLSQLSTLQRNL